MVDANLEAVNHPKHYNSGKIEVIEFIEDQGHGDGFTVGNAIKYLARAGKKHVSAVGEIEDLEKAIWYIKRRIEQVKAQAEDRALVRPNDMNRRAVDLDPKVFVCTTCESVWGKSTEQGESIRQTGECIPCVSKRPQEQKQIPGLEVS